MTKKSGHIGQAFLRGMATLCGASSSDVSPGHLRRIAEQHDATLSIECGIDTSEVLRRQLDVFGDVSGVGDGLGPEEQSRAHGSDSAEGDASPRSIVHVKRGQLTSCVRAAEDALLLGRGCEPIYQRGTQLVRVVRLDVPTTPRRGVALPAHVTSIGAVGRAFLKGVFEDVAEFVTEGSDGQLRPITCPADVLAHYEQMSGHWRIPTLRSVVTAPTMRADGSILQVPGYDPASRLFLDTAGVAFPQIPDEPSLDEARRSVAELLALVEHFEFATEACRSVWLAAVVGATVRHLLPAAPLSAIDASTRGSGKSKAASIPGIIATGRPPATLTFTDDPDELRKRVFALLMSGTQVINIDNVEVPLGGAVLCTVLTEPMFTDRILGVSEMGTVPTTATWLATGNNIAIAGDLARRVLVCRIDPRCERPEDRSFPFDPVLLAEQRRPHLVGAALTLLRAHTVAGRPGEGLGPFGSFEAWSEIIRAAIVWAGEPDPLGGRHLVVEPDGESAAMGGLLAAWSECFGARPITLREVICAEGAALSEAIDQVVGADAPVRNRARILGKVLARWRDRVVGGYRFVMGDTASGGVRRWAAVKV